MWWEAKGEQVLREILATSDSIRGGIDRLLAYFAERRPHAVWQQIAELFEGEVSGMRYWLERQLPFPTRIEVVWFAFWDVTVGFDLRGSTRWSRDPDNWNWWYDADGQGESYESPVLGHMHQLADGVGEPDQSLGSGGVKDLVEYLLTIGYVSLAAAELFRRIEPARLLNSRDELWVVTGFPDGGEGIITGSVTPRGFAPFPQRRPQPRARGARRRA